jgi:asparagine synthetase B (glutamine-hydrolysing)
MSDFIFSSAGAASSFLAGCIRTIHAAEPPGIAEFQGAWGSLAVARNPYHGFEPFENDSTICTVIGRPILSSGSGEPMSNRDGNAGTSAVLERVQANPGADWSTEFSGPFAVLIVDKAAGDVKVLTDMLSFVPVYSVTRAGSLYLGTHVDALACASRCENEIDHTSVADFIMSGVVTFPYTTYVPMRQLDPATLYEWRSGDVEHPRLTCYWLPREDRPFGTLAEAAAELRDGLIDDVDRASAGMEKVACLVSSGEDSRAILAILARHLHPDAITFVPALNFDARVVQTCAQALGAGFKPVIEGASLLLEDFETVSRLIGSTAEAKHTRFYGMYRQAGIRAYDGVFGGYLSDALLKSANLKKIKVPFLPILPDIQRPVAQPWLFNLEDTHSFEPDMVDLIKARRKRHYDRIRNFRPNSAGEWFTLWPRTQGSTMAYFHANRRVFASYEPCMAARVVKVAAACPVSWKFNRRLFHAAVQPLLQPVKWVLHTKGRMPYFSSWNVLAQSAAHIRFALEQSADRNKVAAQDLRAEFESHSAWAECRQLATDTLASRRARIGGGITSDFPHLAIRSKLRVMQLCQTLNREPTVARAA